jgi:hypothetical protein
MSRNRTPTSGTTAESRPGDVDAVTPILLASSVPLHPRLAELLRRMQRAERTARGSQRRPTFRLMREFLSAAVQLGVPLDQLGECLGVNGPGLRTRIQDADGLLDGALIEQLTDLAPSEIDELSEVALTPNPSEPGRYRVIDVVRALIHMPPDGG